MSIISYLLWPNPGKVDYDNPKIIALVVICLILIVGGYVVSRLRRRMQNPVMKKLSRSWPLSGYWFGGVGLFLAISRAEGISFVSMRILWFIWLVVIIIYLFFQVRIYRARHYTVLPNESEVDPREKYLPKRKKK